MNLKEEVESLKVEVDRVVDKVETLREMSLYRSIDSLAKQLQRSKGVLPIGAVRLHKKTWKIF